MRALLLPIALLLLGAGPHDQRVREYRRAGDRGPGVGLAYFEAFPLSGAGTSGACSTTAPTGAKGEALTFTRASNGTCTKTASGGLATTGIADGDLVVLSSNVARVEYDSAGTLGLLVEATRTNSCLRSEAFDDAAWTKYAFGTGSNPTVTANAATAPDGTLTADRVQFTAVDGASQSGILQATAVTTGTDTVSVYVKGVSGSGSIQLAVYSAATCVTCNYVSTSWSRCVATGAITANGHIRIGNDPAVCGGGARAAQDVYLWGAQFEAGAYATSYIPTAGVAVARAAESAYFTVASTEVQSMAATVQIPANINATNVRILGDAQGATKSFTGYSAGPNAVPLHSFQSSGGSKDLSSATNITLSASNRLAVWVIPSTTIGAVVNGTETTSSAGVQAAVDGVTKFYVGCYAGGAGFESNSIHSRLCGDPVASRCR